MFTLARASMGHAGEGGYWTLALAAEVVHLAAIGVWSGAVFVSAWLVLREARVSTIGARAIERYLARMSHGALLAVAAIIVTGAYSAWQRVGSGDHLLHTAYGTTLLFKLGLVGTALALGGYNKFVGLPAAQRSSGGLRLVRNVLRIESVALIGVLIAAAVLTAQQPPTAM
jgi:putative copper resistance protein D